MSKTLISMFRTARLAWGPHRLTVAPSLVTCLGLLIGSWLLVGLGGSDAGAAVSGALETPDQYKTFVINADGSGPSRLTRSSMEDYDPAWSPDGTRIAFSAFSGRSYSSGQIYVMNVDGSGRTRLTDNPNDNFGPTWSPDGTRIAFTRGATGRAEIYVMNADGSGQANLTQRSGDDRNPAWSPDGTKIAFATDRNGAFEIYVMNADGSNQTNLTAEMPFAALEPAWSPDGTRIAFTSYGSADPSSEIFVMNADGGGKTNVTASQAYEWDAAWAPDGTKIAFARNTFSKRAGADTDIYVMNPGGSGRIRLTSSSLESFSPSWSPDGTRIAFTRHSLCRVPKVVGRPLAGARKLILAANCSVGRVRYRRSGRNRGTVLHQNWRAGMLLFAGDPIHLVVSR